MLTREYPPAVYGGAGVHVRELVRATSALASAGEQDSVQVAVHAFGPERADDQVAGSYQPWEALTERPSGGRPELSALRAMSVDLLMAAGVTAEDGPRPDVVHSHTWYANLAGHLAAAIAEVPHVMTTHSLEPHRPWKREQLGAGAALAAFCEQTAIEHADAVIAVSASMRDAVLEAYPVVEPERVRVIHNGIDPQRWQPDTRTDALERFGVDQDRPTVLFVGRITRQKGIVHLLDAVAHLPDGAQVVLAASAPDTPAIATEVAEQLAQLADDPRVHAGVLRMVHIAEQVPEADLRQLLTHAQVLVCPSIYEPFGIVNLEAMACGTAVVASDVGGIPEVVDHGQTGLLVTPEGPDFPRRLAEAIGPLLTDPARADELGAAGRRRVEERFTWEQAARRTAALYRELLAG